MKKQTKGELFQASLFIFIIPLFYWSFFVNPSALAPFIAIIFFAVDGVLIWFFSERKYKVNNPNKQSSKNKIIKRIFLGLLAGLHYIFFIGTYNHKKYNTQVWYPETLECVFGNISEAIILDLYVITGTLIFGIIGFYYLIFLSIPLITTITSLILKNNIKR